MKRRAPNASDGIGDGDGAGFTCRALDEGGLRFVIKDAICTAIVRVSCNHGDCRQAGAITKSTRTDAGNGARYRDTRQAGAMPKPPDSDAGHTRRYRDTR